MESLTRLTAAELTFKCASGAQFTFSPLTLKKLCEYEEWIKLLPFTELHQKIKAAGDALSLTAKDKLAEKAQELSSSAYYRKDTMNSFTGIYQMLRLSLQVKHPSINEKDIDELIDTYGLELLRRKVEEVTYPNENELKNSDSGIEK
jgi:hypothetical protein